MIVFAVSWRIAWKRGDKFDGISSAMPPLRAAFRANRRNGYNRCERVGEKRYCPSPFRTHFELRDSVKPLNSIPLSYLQVA